MRAPLAVLIALVVVNVGLWRLGIVVAREQSNLVASAGGLSTSTDEARRAKERDDVLRALIAAAQTNTASADPRDIGSLRDRILAAERGLALQRTSLDFRPADRVTDGFGGARVQLGMRGPVDALYAYLARIEATGLALAPETLTLRSDGESVALALRWTARWPLVATPQTASLASDQMDSLASWLKRAGASHPTRLRRDLFSFVAAPVAASETVRESRVEAPRPSEIEPTSSSTDATLPELPVLTGFVLARPEAEPDVNRRVLAALRFEDQVRLVMVGDAIGDYRVEGMQARESVTLMQSTTGERIRLTLP